MSDYRDALLALEEAQKTLREANLTLKTVKPAFSSEESVNVVRLRISDFNTYSKIRDDFDTYVEVTNMGRQTDRTGFFIELNYDLGIIGKLEELTDYMDLEQYEFAYIYNN